MLKAESNLQFVNKTITTCKKVLTSIDMPVNYSFLTFLLCLQDRFNEFMVLNENMELSVSYTFFYKKIINLPELQLS